MQQQDPSSTFDGDEISIPEFDDDEDEEDMDVSNVIEPSDVQRPCPQFTLPQSRPMFRLGDERNYRL